MQDKYPRVSKVQLELWLESPVTKAVSLAYHEIINRIDAEVSAGYCIDSSNNDLSMNQIHSALGTKQGLENAGKFEEALRMCSLIEEDK